MRDVDDALHDYYGEGEGPHKAFLKSLRTMMHGYALERNLDQKDFDHMIEFVMDDAQISKKDREELRDVAIQALKT